MWDSAGATRNSVVLSAIFQASGNRASCFMTSKSHRIAAKWAFSEETTSQLGASCRQMSADPSVELQSMRTPWSNISRWCFSHQGSR